MKKPALITQIGGNVVLMIDDVRVADASNPAELEKLKGIVLDLKNEIEFTRESYLAVPWLRDLLNMRWMDEIQSAKLP